MNIRKLNYLKHKIGVIFDVFLIAFGYTNVAHNLTPRIRKLLMDCA